MANKLNKDEKTVADDISIALAELLEKLNLSGVSSPERKAIGRLAAKIKTKVVPFEPDIDKVNVVKFLGALFIGFCPELLKQNKKKVIEFFNTPEDELKNKPLESKKK